MEFLKIEELPHETQELFQRLLEQQQREQENRMNEELRQQKDNLLGELAVERTKRLEEAIRAADAAETLRQGPPVTPQQTPTVSNPVNIASFYKLRSTSSIAPWDGSVKHGESLTEKFNVFRVQMENCFRQEGCVSAFSADVPIKIHFESEEELKRKYDSDAVDQATRAWNILIEKIVYPPSRRADHDVGIAK